MLFAESCEKLYFARRNRCELEIRMLCLLTGVDGAQKINFKIPKARETAKKSVTRSLRNSYTFRMEFFENIPVGLPLI